MREEKVEFYSEGQKVIGILHIPDVENPPAIIIVHGYGGYIFTDRFKHIASDFCKVGYATLRFAFRGFDSETGDKSTKEFKNLTISGEISDLKAAIDFMYSKGYRKIGLASESLGGTIIILLNDTRVKALAFWSANIHVKATFENLYGDKMIKEIEEKGRAIYTSHTTGNKFEIGKKFWDEVKKIEDISERKIKAIKCPILIIHGANDRYFGVKVAKDLYKIANKPKKLLIIEGANHTFVELECRQQLIDAILDWFKRYLD
jgi:esterase/lipase